MAEYIEREAFKAKYLCCGYLPEMSEKEFDQFPAADVAPVVHGRWVRKGSNWYCTGCDKGYRISCGSPSANTFDYCPNCGAKMDGGAE